MKFTEFNITENDENRRADRVLKKFLPHIPLSGIYSNLRKGKIKLNGKKVKPSKILINGDTLKIADELLNFQTNLRGQKLENMNLSIEILFHDEHFLILNKPENQIVHGTNSLNDYIKQQFPAGQNSLSFKPGPLHRLDKNTTGILTFSQSLAGAQVFSEMLQNNQLERYYIGLVMGKLNQTCWKTKTNDGKPSITDVTPIYYFSHLNLTLTEFRLHTGRKHQIRIQCQKFSHPLYGDTQFGSPRTKQNYLLHCYKLQFQTKILTLPPKIIAPLPLRFKNFLNKNNFKFSSNSDLNYDSTQ